jgi:hypothetical protein
MPTFGFFAKKNSFYKIFLYRIIEINLQKLKQYLTANAIKLSSISTTLSTA